jgi:hypothetical protein
VLYRLYDGVGVGQAGPQQVSTALGQELADSLAALW